MADPHYMAWGRDDPFRRIETAAEALARRVVWEQGNRIGLLRVHGVVGVLAGVQMLAFGGPSQLEAFPWARLWLGLTGLCGGTLVMYGLHRRPRSIPTEAAGLAVLGLWDLTMTVGLAWARLHTTSWGWSWPWEKPPPAASGYVPAYPVTVYAGLFALICIHLLTLQRFVKSGAPPAGAVKREAREMNDES